MRGSSRAAHIKDGQREPRASLPLSCHGAVGPRRPPRHRSPSPAADRRPPRQAIFNTLDKNAFSLFLLVCWGQTLTPPQVTFREAFSSAATASAARGAGAGPARRAAAGSRFTAGEELRLIPAELPKRPAATCDTPLQPGTPSFQPAGGPERRRR